MKQLSYIFFTLILVGCIKTLERSNPIDGKTLAVLSANTPSNVTATTAILGGYISNDGGLPITEKGVVYATSTYPTINNSKSNAGTGTSSFTTTVSGLLPNTTYYARTYAVNLVGVAYSAQVSFKTSITAPTVITNSVSSILNSTAVANSTVSLDNGATVTARGVVWSTTTAPTITLNTKTRDSSGTGTFISAITGLNALTTYYVRAYATNSIGTSYGNEIVIKTLANLPTVTTKAITNIASTYATTGGDVTNDGGAVVTARGVVWSTSSGPTTSLTTKYTDAGTGIGSFTNTITGLTVGQRYYVRAFATNSTGTAYGNEQVFTSQVVVPTLSNLLVSNITSSSINVTGTVNTDGGGTITDYGIVYGTSQNPTTLTGTKGSVGTSTNGLTTNIPIAKVISGLNRVTTYYVRAYAINSAGTGYGNQYTVTTIAAVPTLTTADATSLTVTTVTIGGSVTDDGGSSVTLRGIVISTTTGPTVDVNLSKSTNGSGTGSFSTNFSGLTRSTKYYYRPFATNAMGTNYGAEKTFTTNAN
jgi:hypothetical protein